MVQMLFCLLLLPGLLAANADERDWPQFRGPNGQGIAVNSKPPTHFGPDTNLLWKAEVPPGLSSPIVWGNRVFLTAIANNQLLTLAYDVADGRELWRRVTPAEKIEPCHSFSSPAASTPCTDGERVYAYFGSYGVTAYDFHGKEVWTHPLTFLPMQYGTASSPIIYAGRIYLQRDGESANSELLALDAKTGKTAWQAARPFARSSYSTPVIWHHDGAEEIVLRGRGRLAAYDLGGKELWYVNGWGFACASSPAVSKDYILAGGSGTGDPAEPRDPMLEWNDLSARYDVNHDDQLAIDEVPIDRGLILRKEIPKEAPGNFLPLRFIADFADKNKDKQVTKEEWNALQTFLYSKENADKFVAVRGGGHGDVGATHVAWETARGLSEIPSPLFYQGRLYLVRDGSMLTIFEPATGKRILDRERFGKGVQFVASPIAANGLLYLFGEPGDCTVIPAGDKIEITSSSKLGEHIRCTPAIAADRLYIRSLDHLWAFGQPTPGHDR